MTYMGVYGFKYNESLARLFTEDKEAIYFRNKEELLEKLKFLINNEDYLREISFAGQKKCHELGVTIKDRVKKLEKNIFDRFFFT